jgi:Phosphate-selective porin O and P
MKLLLSKPVGIAIILITMFSGPVRAQFLMDMIDTTTDIGKGMFELYKKFDRVRISGYLQPQFQVAQEKGIESYNGGDFATNSKSRFMLRRGRIRFDYAHFTDSGEAVFHFVFQFDGTERGVNIRDFWGRIFETRFDIFSLTTGMFARPFGYELNLSSSDRESPERGRMSQILMRTERDLGAMVSFEPRNRKHPLRYLKWDAGIFNGQGLTAPGEFDSHKDFITRLSLKPYPLSKKTYLSVGLSYLNGGLEQTSRYVYTMQTKPPKNFEVDSSVENLGKIAPRKYYGTDAQLKIKHAWGFTDLRAEYWFGTQTSNEISSETPTTALNEPYYIRNFDGAFIYLLQNIVHTKHQIGLKYDWYDPNTDVKGSEIGVTGSNMNATDIKYSTLSVGYNYYMNENVKLSLWYDWVKNENTELNGYETDIRDNVFTCRLQFRF